MWAKDPQVLDMLVLWGALAGSIKKLLKCELGLLCVILERLNPVCALSFLRGNGNPKG